MAAHSSDAAPLYIPSRRVKELVSMGDVLKAVETGLGAYSRQNSGVVQPVRSVVPITEHAGFLGVMPAYCPEANSLTAKLITYYRLSKNAEKGLPTHQSIIAVFEPSTGTLLALVDGQLLTKMRTAAASAIALKVLKGCLNPKILCIVGSGILARSHAEALKFICQFDEIRVWGRNADHARQCAVDIGDGCVAYESLQEACSGADVFVTVTVATSPVLCGKWIKDGAIVCGVGACRPDWREIDDELMNNSIVVADSRAGVEKESGDVVLSRAEVYCEVGELINGTVQPITAETLKSQNKKFIFFKSLGMAVEDAVTAQLVYDRHAQEAK